MPYKLNFLIFYFDNVDENYSPKLPHLSQPLSSSAKLYILESKALITVGNIPNLIFFFLHQIGTITNNHVVLILNGERVFTVYELVKPLIGRQYILIIIFVLSVQYSF